MWPASRRLRPSEGLGAEGLSSTADGTKCDSGSAPSARAPPRHWVLPRLRRAGPHAALTRARNVHFRQTPQGHKQAVLTSTSGTASPALRGPQTCRWGAGQAQPEQADLSASETCADAVRQPATEGCRNTQHHGNTKSQHIEIMKYFLAAEACGQKYYLTKRRSYHRV